MDGEGRSVGLWIGLGVALAAAVAFLVLWHLRGGEIDRLTGELRSVEASSSEQIRKLENDVRGAKTDHEAAIRRIDQMETQFRDEVRRSADSATQAERRLRSELDISTSKLRAANAELAKLKREGSSQAVSEAVSLREDLEKARAELEEHRAARQQEVDGLNSDLETAKGVIGTFEQRLAQAEETLATREKEYQQAKENLEKAGILPGDGEGHNLKEVLEDVARLNQKLDEARKTGVAHQDEANRLAKELVRVKTEAAEREEELLKTIDRLTGTTSIEALKPVPAPADAAKMAERDLSGYTESPRGEKRRMAEAETLEIEAEAHRKNEDVLSSPENADNAHATGEE